MKTSYLFLEKDLSQLADKGLSMEAASSQLQRFRKGFAPLKISEPATIGHGILTLSNEDLVSYIRIYEDADVDTIKFVPASGAATRMFKHLFAFLEKFDGKPTSIEPIFKGEKNVEKFFRDLEKFAFYKDLKKEILSKRGITVEEAIKSCKHNLIVETLLNENGLNFGNLPKALIPFHNYDSDVRTAAQEQLAEALDYANKNGMARIHFTVSSDYRDTFENHIEESVNQLNSEIKVRASFSIQKQDTDTLAVNSELDPFRDENSNLLFRPAGHGALLENLNELTEDLVFIKNIDNVVPDRLRAEGTRYKKALAGILLDFQNKAFNLLRSAEAGNSIYVEGRKLLSEMGVVGEFSEEEIVSYLDRPIRVCGMVKNEGEPGGGPFWVLEENCKSLQIVESAQIEKTNEKQLSIFKSGTHFNPVDIVCGVKNHKGEKYNLLDYRDEEAGFISEKTYNGRKLLAMELPGLWNGSMSNWNTIFVEVPLVTFNPVKTVTDLLKAAHR